MLASAQVFQDSLAQLDSAFGPQSFFDGHLTGFMLYDLESKQVVFEKNSHLYQIPASTAKLLTLYAGLTILEDSTQTLRYKSSGDTLKIWGSGDPSWKYKNFDQPDFQKIIGNHAVVQFSDANQVSPGYGYGWQWDDYYYDYSTERSSLPIYGNMVEVSKSGDTIQLTPQIFQTKLLCCNHENYRHHAHRNPGPNEYLANKRERLYAHIH